MWWCCRRSCSDARHALHSPVALLLRLQRAVDVDRAHVHRVATGARARCDVHGRRGAHVQLDALGPWGGDDVPRLPALAHEVDHAVVATTALERQ